MKYFVCNTNSRFRQAAKTHFPRVTIIAGKYQVSRQANWAVENLRKNGLKELAGKFRRYTRHSKYLLLHPLEKLRHQDMDQLALMLEITPKLADAYRIRNEFLSIFRYKSSAKRKP